MERTRDNNNNKIKGYNLSNIQKSCPKESPVNPIKYSWHSKSQASLNRELFSLPGEF